MSVTLKNITKIFTDPSNQAREVVAVKDVNLEIQEGEMVTFLGPSGCGKTTTLRIISGFETPTKGEVWISGTLVNEIPPNKRDTSMVFQSYAIFPHLSVSQNIGFGLELKGVKPKEIKRQVEEIMEVMTLTNLYNRRPDQLSGGQQQRVALARAIINRPKVLLFDEPLSNLDAKLRDQMRIEIRRIQQSFGITSIYVTHDQDEAMTVSDRIMVMKDGEVMQIGTPFEIYSRPANTFVADFIGRVNLIDAVVETVKPESISVVCGGGGEHRHKVITSWAGNFKKGDAARIVVRPESLRLSRMGGSAAGTDGKRTAPSAATAEEPFLKGIIRRSVYLGPTVEYEIDVLDVKTQILAVTYNPVEEGFYRTGEEVGINFSSTASHLL
jgi:iron(III) transport system ATP-binding protein